MSSFSMDCEHALPGRDGNGLTQSGISDVALPLRDDCCEREGLCGRPTPDELGGCGGAEACDEPDKGRFPCMVGGQLHEENFCMLAWHALWA